MRHKRDIPQKGEADGPPIKTQEKKDLPEQIVIPDPLLVGG
jgi:hypothetical protein